MSEVLEMKTCKECGKMFRPRHKRQVYCDDIHYRPCPVCGKPVEAKYLSDPARVCSIECKKILSQKSKTKDKEPKKIIENISAAVVEETNNVSINNNSVLSSNIEENTDKHIDNIVESSESSNVQKVQKVQNVEKVQKADPDSFDSVSEYEQYLKSSYKVKLYAGKDVLGFIKRHSYAIEITKPSGEHVYTVNAIYDFTEHKTVDLVLPVSSMSSFYRMFKAI